MNIHSQAMHGMEPTAQRIVEHWTNLFPNIEPESEPFFHGCPRNVFPDDIYRAIQNSMPPDSAYEPMNKDKWRDASGVSTRDQITLNDDGVKVMPEEHRPLWRAIGQALASMELKNFVFEHLKEDLALTMNCPVDQVKRKPIHVGAWLRTETKAYHLEPHLDGWPRVATMLIYLPADDSEADLGTSLYDHAPRWRRPFGPRHLEVKRAPSTANTAAYFSGGARPARPGWHGFERRAESKSGLRRSILVTWYGAEPDTPKGREEAVLLPGS